jgi:hypothetical protein
MSKFKNNSRFAILAEEIETNNNNNSRNNNNNNNNSRNNNNNNNNNNNSRSLYLRDENVKKDIILVAEDFPELCAPKLINNTLINLVSFSDKLKTEIKHEEKINLDIDIDLELKNLKPGWTLLKYDTESRKIIIKTKDCTLLKSQVKSDNEKIYDSLVDLHKKQTEDFIELWGYDEWEKTFIFPNYDYEYFDRMDQLYAEEEEEEERKLENLANEYEYDYNYNSDY